MCMDVPPPNVQLPDVQVVWRILLLSETGENEVRGIWCRLAREPGAKKNHSA